MHKPVSVDFVQDFADEELFDNIMNNSFLNQQIDSVSRQKKLELGIIDEIEESKLQIASSSENDEGSEECDMIFQSQVEDNLNNLSVKQRPVSCAILQDLSDLGHSANLQFKVPASQLYRSQEQVYDSADNTAFIVAKKVRSVKDPF